MTTWANNTINKATDSVAGTSANTDATSPQTAGNDDSVGTVAWGDPDYSKVTGDSLYSQALAITTAGTFQTNYLKASNFGFSIPTGATINGIKVEFNKDKFAGSSDVKDTEVKIVKGGSIGSTNKAETTTDWSESFSYVDYGGATDLWGETWTAEDINLSTFGVVMAVNLTKTAIARVDHIRITVYYTTAGTTKEVLTHTYVIEGDGDYVDTGQKVSIGSTTIGSKVIGGGGSTEASPFEISFPINSDRFVDVRIRVEAVGIGFVQCNSFRFHDIRDKGVHNLPTRTT